MDSLSQLALGAAVGVAVMGRRTRPWKAAAFGALAGTLPDLDVFLDWGDPIANMVLHRAETHALFWLTLFALPFGALVAWLAREWTQWRHWMLAMWAALVTHPLLDAMTVYGTQLALPFSDHPFGVGSVFIIDPLYTLPLLGGVAIATTMGTLRANTIGLALSCAYLGWGVLAQQHVRDSAVAALAAQGVAHERLLVTPTAFNSVLWRVVAVGDTTYHEGYRSLFDRGRAMHFDRFERGAALEQALADTTALRRVAAFSRGFYKLEARGDAVVLADLRMGQEPHYTFAFEIARLRSALVPLQPVVQVGSRPPLERALSWLWRRALGEPLPPPR
jgi:inner membrane protein